VRTSDKAGALKKTKRNLTSEAARALVQVKHERSTKAERIAHGKLMGQARWQSPAGLAKRRTILEKKIAELQTKLAEIEKLEQAIR
jgi:hypothetical protein